MLSRERSDPGLGSGPPRYPGGFLLAFQEAAKLLGWRLQQLKQDVALCVDEENHEYRIGIENLYRRARRTPRADWPELIANFLHTIGEAEDAEETPPPLAEVADRLLLRLGPPFAPTAELAGIGIWHQPLSDTNLVLNLVIDYEDRMGYVTEKQVAESGVPGQEWLKQAQANLLSRTPPDCLQVVHEDSGMRICAVGDAYDSSRAILLDHLLPETSAEGFLVILPGRDELLVLPVTLQAVPHIHLMKVLAEKNYRSAPYPISNEVYWVRQGAWSRFPIHIKNSKATVQPPPEFLEVLQRLCPPGEEESCST